MIDLLEKKKIIEDELETYEGQWTLVFYDKNNKSYTDPVDVYDTQEDALRRFQELQYHLLKYTDAFLIDDAKTWKLTNPNYLYGLVLPLNPSKKPLDAA